MIIFFYINIIAFSLDRIKFYTGNVFDTDRRNIEVKKRKPLEPPGTSAKIIKNNVII